MTREDVIRLAKEAGLSPPQEIVVNDYWTADESDLIRFAALVAQAKVEECARIIEAQDVDPAFKMRLAAAIRGSK